MNINFLDDRHEILYNTLCDRMKKQDRYHLAMAYLLALDSELRKHYLDVFDFENDGIKINALNKAWQTGTSKKTTRLAFNLWNGCSTDGETYTDKGGYERDLPSSYYTPEQIFCSVYAAFYWQAIKIRFYY